MMNLNKRITVLTFFGISAFFINESYAFNNRLLSGPDTTSNVLIQDDPIAAMLDNLVHLKYFETTNQEISALDKYGFAPDSVPVYSDLIYATRISKLNIASPFSLDYNDAVKSYIDLYSVRKREQVSKMLGLANLYFPLFEERLDKFNMPLELKYLAIVESALNPEAKSRSGAMGLWQFMYGTGKMFGLKINSYVDERCDPYLSTEAACKYMQYLYKMYGDWQLVLAAYNAGPGTVNKAIRRSGGKRNYWDLRPFLPAETRGYVPAFIAVNYIMNYSTEHNLYPTTVRFYHYEIDTIKVSRPLKFEQISSVLGVSLEELEFLNPCYRKNFIPCSEGEFQTLCLSKPMVASFINNESSIYSSHGKEDLENGISSFSPVSSLPPVQFVSKEVKKTHIVKKGEHLTGIADKYDCTVTDIREWNNLKSNSLYAGQRLTLHSTIKEAIIVNNNPAITQPAALIESQKPMSQVPGARYIYYTIQPGDTLWYIANRYNGVSVDDIKKLNNIKDVNNLQPGTNIKVSLVE